jgi:hypothetical protein
LKYIAGYVKFRLTTKFPNARDPFPPMKAEGSWIELKSRGGLQYPSDVLVAMFKKWGFFFDGFHGPDVYRGDKPIDKLVNIIVRKEDLRSEVDKYVAEMFVRVRFFQRIKLLNERVKANEKKETLRKMKQAGQFIC